MSWKWLNNLVRISTAVIFYFLANKKAVQFLEKWTANDFFYNLSNYACKDCITLDTYAVVSRNGGIP